MKGGYRPGSGRPKGSTTKPQISDYVTRKEVKDLVKMAKDMAPEKPEILKFLLEQIFGRAVQPVEASGGVVVNLQFDSSLKNAVPRKTKGNSKK